MAIVQANTDTFNEEIAGQLTLVDFYADWCGPCKMIAPVLEQIADEDTNLKIVKLNVDESPELATKYGVMSIPTLILMKDGEPVAQTMGYQPKEKLLQWINSHQ